MNNRVWVEKYIPQVASDLILPVKGREHLLDLLLNKRTPYGSVLLHSKEPGTGKTSFANILGKRNDLDTVEIITTGCGIGEINRMRTICKGSWPGMKWLFILNEVSESSLQFRQGLRNLMDETDSVAFYIFTDNDEPKLFKENPAVFADERVRRIDFATPPKEDYTAKLVSIFKNEGIVGYDKLAESVADDAYPSIRRGIKNLEAQALKNKLGPYKLEEE